VNTKSEGGLVVSKQVVSAIEADHDKEFQIVVTLTPGEDAEDINGTYGDAEFTDNVSAPLVLKDGETAVITGLPKGTGYTVTETLSKPDGKIYTVSYSGDVDDNTIAQNDTKYVLVTNTRNTTDLTIEKDVSSNIEADKTEYFRFTVKLSYNNQPIEGSYAGIYFDGGEATITLKKGDTITLKEKYEDKSYDFVIKTSPVAELVLKAAGLEKASGNAKQIVGSITEAQLTEIAQYKLPDLNTDDIEAAKKIIAGSCRQMGIAIK
jgi:hypothetical protein